MASNATAASWALPALPEYTLTPRPPLVPFLADKHLSMLLIFVAYWAMSILFHIIDVYDLFPQYRLHTPAEIANRNRAGRFEVLRDVLFCQALQTLCGVALGYFEEDEFTGKDDYNIAVYARYLRTAQRAVPPALALVGLDAHALAGKTAASSPVLAAVLAGGQYTDKTGSPAFASWELALAQLLYWIVVPALQYFVAVAILDAWQYFMHRAMHVNKFLYTTIHSRHHRLYVPYAYGALYNHPLESLMMDSIGSVVASLAGGLTPRMSMCFFTFSTFKTVDDHSGYAFPWDPLQHITGNNAAYHDIHHQSWGIKTNFAQPFSTFWDRHLGTIWSGGDVTLRYERARAAAEKAINAGKGDVAPLSGTRPIDSVLESPEPYADDAAAASDAAAAAGLPEVPPGKATAQARASRQQVLSDAAGGGARVLAEESAEEAAERERAGAGAGAGAAAAANVAKLSGRPKRNSLRGLAGAHGGAPSVLGYNGAH